MPEGVISGRLFTADHPDSLARGASVTLIYGRAEGERSELVAASGPDGVYRFDGLSTDPNITYLLRVDFRGESFLGPPTGFETGEVALDRSFLVSPQAPPLDRMLTGEAMPSDHPPVPALHGEPTPIQPGITLLLVLLIVAAWLGPWLWIRRRDRGAARPRAEGEIEALIRDIAGLDARHAAGQLPSEDWTRVRGRLMEELQRRAL